MLKPMNVLLSYFNRGYVSLSAAVMMYLKEHPAISLSTLSMFTQYISLSVRSRKMYRSCIYCRRVLGCSLGRLTDCDHPIEWHAILTCVCLCGLNVCEYYRFICLVKILYTVQANFDQFCFTCHRRGMLWSNPNLLSANISLCLWLWSWFLL